MKGLKLLLLTFATLAITACSDDTTDEWHGDFGSIQVPDTRQLSQKIPAGQTAGNSEIFFSTNDAWNSAITDESRAEAPTWVRINPDHGDAAGDYDIRVETDPNTAEESRTAFIEITCGTNSILITITQSGTDGEDTNEPDEPNIGEQVRYWQLHKIVGRDASGSLIAEMEYTYELPAEFSKECRITGFKISAADKNGTLRPVETWQFTYEGDDCIRFSFTREIDGEQPYTQTADGTLYGYFCDVRSGGYELTSTLSGSEIETYGFDCTYGTGTFNSDKLTSISRYNSLTLEPICEKYEWEKDPWGPLEAWDNCSAVIRTLENEPNTETFRQEYGYDYDETTAWSDFIYELEGTPLLNSDPILMFSPLPDKLRQGQLSISGIWQTASSQPELLQQTALSEAVLTAPRDNQVIEQPNIEQRSRLGNFLRENLILLAGQGSTGRMVVNQDNLRGQQFEGPFDDQPVIHHRRLHPALAYPLPLDDPVARIEVQAPALLVLHLRQQGSEYSDHIVARTDRIGSQLPGSKHPAAQFDSRLNPSGAFEADSGSHTQPRDVGISQCGEPPFETGQQRPGKPLRITVVQQQFQQLLIGQRFNAPGKQFYRRFAHDTPVPFGR